MTAIMFQEHWNPADNFSRIAAPFVEPGSNNYSYANSILLGLIAVHKGGKSANTLLQETFFEPLGLSGGLLPEVTPPADTAKPYDELADYGLGTGFGNLRAGPLAVFEGKDSRISWVGAGIVSTPENVSRWGYELFSPSGSALSNESRTQLIDSLRVEAGPTMSGLGVHTYGYYIGMADVSISDGSRLTTYTHPGGGGGRTSHLYYAPSLDVSVSLLANSMTLHDFGSCRYQGRGYVSVGECMAGGIFSTLLGMPVFPTTTSALPPVETAEIEISDSSFTGATEVLLGQRIRFTNQDGASHTATSGAFDTGTIAGGQSVELVINQAGTYTYFCLFHDGMTGTITVID